MTALSDAIISLPNARSALRWLEKSRTPLLLNELARRGEAITHEALDELPHGAERDRLRQILVHTGALPKRVELLESIEPWLNEQLVGRPAQHAQVLKAFTRWGVLRPARRLAARGRYTERTAWRNRDEIRSALRLMAWLDDQQISLEDLSQGDIDAWVIDGPPNRRHTRAFLKWTAARGLTKLIDVPQQRSPEPQHFISDDDLVHHLQRCMDDDSLPLDVRVAGALILLFGLRMTRLLALTTAHISKKERDTYLTVSTNPVLMPPKLAVLVDQLANQPRQTSLLKTLSGAPALLFPGQPPSRPLTNSAFGRRLRRHGFPVGPGRNTAMITLTTELPAAVVADLFGVHISSATAWAQYTQHRWDDYLAARTPEITEKPGWLCTRERSRGPVP